MLCQNDLRFLNLTQAFQQLVSKLQQFPGHNLDGKSLSRYRHWIPSEAVVIAAELPSEMSNQIMNGN